MAVTATEIYSFLDWLRDGGSGFEAGDQQYIAACKLVEMLVMRGEWPADSPELCSLLAPVLCSSPVQQNRFHESFRQWFLASRATIVEDGSDDDIGPRPKRPIPREAWIYGFLCIAGATALLIGMVLYWPHRLNIAIAPTHVHATNLNPISYSKHNPVIIVRSPEGKPLLGAIVRYSGHSNPTNASGEAQLTPDDSAPPRFLIVALAGYRTVVTNFPKTDLRITMQPAETIPLPVHQDHWYIHHAQVLRFLIMAMPGVLILFWLARLWRKALELRRWASTSEPRMRRIRTTNQAEPLFSATDIRKLAVALRRRRPDESTELDLQSTVERTCRNAGYFTPVFAKRNSEPEYLFLGERKTLRDHQARLQDELIHCLRNHDVVVQRYYFQANPSICSDSEGDAFSLSELAAMHPEYELWLSLDTGCCVNAITGVPERWWGQLSHWRYRALLSFGKTEIDSDLRTVDPTRKGIERLVFESAQPQGQDSYPSVVMNTPEAWLNKLDPPPAAIARLIAQLRIYLGEAGYLLLQATAVYPDIAWNITASLANSLVPATEREEILNRLTALPWFRHGKMPDWLRVRLVSRLGAKEKHVRAAVRRFLDGSIDTATQKQEALEIVPATLHKGRAKSALHDHVYLTFASRRRLDNLSVEAPPGWRRFLRDSVWLRVGAATTLTAILWIVTTSTMNRLVHQSEQGPRRRIFNATSSNPFVTTLLEVAEGYETTEKPLVGVIRLKSYSDAASDVMDVSDPLASLSASFNLENIARKLRPTDPLIPGVVVVTDRGPELVKAVEGSELLTFGSSTWTATTDRREAFDLSGINLKPRSSERSVPVTPESLSSAVQQQKQVNVANTLNAAPSQSISPSLDSVIARSPDGKFYAQSGPSGAITVWEISTGHPILQLRGITARVIEIKWSADGRQLTSRSIDGTTRQWDLATGREMRIQSDVTADQLANDCNNKNGQACASLGQRYQNGESVPQDDARAAKLFQTSCDIGYGQGCTLIGALYELGEGVGQDLSQAVQFYRKACDLGDSTGCNKYKLINEKIQSETVASQSASDRRTSLERMFLSRSRTVITSGGSGSVQDSGPDGHSVFADALLQALASPRNGAFTSSELFASIRSQVAVTSSSKQIPTFGTLTGETSGDFVFEPLNSSTTSFGGGKYYALLIGNDDYRPPMPKLRGSVLDVQSLANVLKSNYGFLVTTLTNATREDIFNALEQEQRTLGPDDNLLIYFAGAGTWNQGSGESYWLPVDAASDSHANDISTSEITNFSSEYPARHVLIISDSCSQQGFAKGAQR